MTRITTKNPQWQKTINEGRNNNNALTTKRQRIMFPQQWSFDSMAMAKQCCKMKSFYDDKKHNKVIIQMCTKITLEVRYTGPSVGITIIHSHFQQYY